MKQDKDKFVLRLPDGWRKRIKIRADRNRRSMTQEMLTALEPVVMEEFENDHAV